MSDYMANKADDQITAGIHTYEQMSADIDRLTQKNAALLTALNGIAKEAETVLNTYVPVSDGAASEDTVRRIATDMRDALRSILAIAAAGKG